MWPWSTHVTIHPCDYTHKTHTLLNNGLDKLSCRMHKSLTIAILYKVLFLENKIL